MTEPLACYRCGASLVALSLPLSRLDLCPSCNAELHCCRMCTHYAPRLTRGCDEDDAPEVRDRETANFCDYFTPNPRAYAPAAEEAEAAARARLASLFGDEDAAPPPEPENSPEQERARREAEALFKR